MQLPDHRTESCGSCKYFRPTLHPQAPPGHGYCVRYPPQCFYQVQMNAVGMVKPEVEAGDYCGEYKAKIIDISTFRKEAGSG